MNIQVFSDEKELDKAAAELYIQLLNKKPDAVLGFATGSTPIGIYQQLIEANRQGKISFAKATSYNLDEYVGLSKDHPQSYAKFMDDHLFQHIDMPESNHFIPNGVAENLEEECLNYDRMLSKAGRIDLMLLGMGLNGHIAFNEPNEELQPYTHVVTLEENTREVNSRFFNSIDEVPSQALSMGMVSIMHSREILLVAKGLNKAEIVRRTLTGPITTQCPSSLLQTHAGLIVMLDKEAASLL